MIKKKSWEKSEGRWDSLMNSTEHLQKKVQLSTVFQKRETERLPNSFDEVSIALMSKQDKDIIRKGNYRLIYLL